ncbi:MAG: ATP phosphoribosyltransferase, partial [Lentisphaerae bacterium]|nr:ATP phosphoribosyltransferase [Lentisphaerota bacterium]
LTNSFLAENNITADVEFSWGATEVKAPALVDAIVELTETGSSLKANNLCILATVLESTTRFIANKKAWSAPDKQKKLNQIAMLLSGALAAESKVLLKMNADRKCLDKVVAALPSLRSPTINTLSDSSWVAIESVVNESVVREIIPKLKDAGAEGIIEIPLNKIIE